MFLLTLYVIIKYNIQRGVSHLTTNEALDYLIENGVKIDIQTLRRWLRTGIVKGTMSAKNKGYQIDKQSLDEQIQKKLETEVKRTDDYKVGYKDGFEAAKQLYFSEELVDIKSKLDELLQQRENEQN